ncbi:MAG: hypothetical protein H7210_07850 [Pyrinomonadaceae bacterium]|nr:hypothetical protein [Phycisphaerales bacterium]
MNSPAKSISKTIRSVVARRLLPAGVLAIGLLCVSGCNIVAGAAYIVHGPEKVPKIYSLDPTKKTVVFVDDTVPVVKSRMQRVKIATTAEGLLLNEGKMEHLIASQDLLAIVERERFSKPMGSVEMGEAVGAEVVVYAQMLSFDLTADQQSFMPSAQVRVKVMDVKTKKRLWPEGVQEWYSLEVKSKEKQGGPPPTLSERDAEFMALAQRVGTSIAHIFVTHEANKQDGRIDQ